MTDIADTLAVIAELASHRASTRLFTSDDARAILDHIAAQDQALATAQLLVVAADDARKAAETKRDAALRHVEALQAKHTDKCCACAYDNPDDVCWPHTLMADLEAAATNLLAFTEYAPEAQRPDVWHKRLAALRRAIEAGQHKDTAPDAAMLFAERAFEFPYIHPVATGFRAGQAHKRAEIVAKLRGKADRGQGHVATLREAARLLETGEL